MPNTFFIGCTHFDHANIIKLAKRPFNHVDEMNATLVRNWNSVVSPEDTVYHLGDFAWKNHNFWLSQLKGQIIKVQGNHDPENWSPFMILEEKELWAKWFVLCHYPMEDWNGRYKGNIHLHAHTHHRDFRRPAIPYLYDSALAKEGEWGKRLPDGFNLGCNRFNVCVESINYTPISMEEILTQALKTYHEL